MLKKRKAVIIVAILLFSVLIINFTGNYGKKVCEVDGCENYCEEGEKYCSEHKCRLDGCSEKAESGSIYCKYHTDLFYDLSTSKNSTWNNNNKKSDSETSSDFYSKQNKSYYTVSSSDLYDQYDLHDYKSKEEFAEDKYEEFYEYEDEFEDEDEAFDAAEDYWED
ncbi:MAG: hypothetical protein K5894_12830, partial [Lachnospiraceae bacterium]|nr:hypothetical protein [Lachnospiraceae bacterium]